MRVRTSTGVRPTDFFGHFFMSNTTDMELASMDCDKTVALEIKHDDKLTEEEGVYVQVALLHTSCSGQRRIRILNLALKTCSQMADLYRACELDSIMNFFGKQGYIIVSWLLLLTFETWDILFLSNCRKTIYKVIYLMYMLVCNLLHVVSVSIGLWLSPQVFQVKKSYIVHTVYIHS